MFRVIHVFQRNCIKNSFHHGQTVDAFSSYGKSAFFSESCVEGKTGLNHTHGVCVCATYCANETEIIKEKKRKGNSLSISYFYLLSRDALLLSKIDAIDATKSTLSFEVRISTIYFFFSLSIVRVCQSNAISRLFMFHYLEIHLLMEHGRVI